MSSPPSPSNLNYANLIRKNRPRQVNIMRSRKREHSRKPDELYDIIEQCSPDPYLEMFARHERPNWVRWGDGVPLSEHAQLPLSVGA